MRHLLNFSYVSRSPVFLLFHCDSCLFCAPYSRGVISLAGSRTNDRQLFLVHWKIPSKLDLSKQDFETERMKQGKGEENIGGVRVCQSFLVL